MFYIIPDVSNNDRSKEIHKFAGRNDALNLVACHYREAESEEGSRRIKLSITVDKINYVCLSHVQIICVQLCKVPYINPLYNPPQNKASALWSGRLTDQSRIWFDPGWLFLQKVCLCTRLRDGQCWAAAKTQHCANVLCFVLIERLVEV